MEKNITIFRNDNYEEWKESLIKEGESEENLTEERYHEDNCFLLGDIRNDLDYLVDGVIVVFAELGLWNGKRNGAKTCGSNLKNILNSTCGEYVHFYMDKYYNVWCEDHHHDGTNVYLYRVAENQDKANRLVDAIAYKGMTEKEFRKRTKSLASYVKDIY